MYMYTHVHAHNPITHILTHVYTHVITHYTHVYIKYTLKHLRQRIVVPFQEKGDLKAWPRSTDASAAVEPDLFSLMGAKRELENRVVDLKDEQDQANLWAESLLQSKAWLKLANQMIMKQHQKEVEAREEMEQTKTTMYNKVRVMCGWMGS